MPFHQTNDTERRVIAFVQAEMGFDQTFGCGDVVVEK
jgi:hypothetical protein